MNSVCFPRHPAPGHVHPRSDSIRRFSNPIRKPWSIRAEGKNGKILMQKRRSCGFQMPRNENELPPIQATPETLRAPRHTNRSYSVRILNFSSLLVRRGESKLEPGCRANNNDSVVSIAPKTSLLGGCRHRPPPLSPNRANLGLASMRHRHMLTPGGVARERASHLAGSPPEQSLYLLTSTQGTVLISRICWRLHRHIGCWTVP